MNSKVISGSTQLTTKGIEKHYRNQKPHEALFELVWNGLDANATKIEVNISQNDMDGIEEITITDNGIGIDFHNIDENFGRFNDSSKTSIDQHGSQGKGRLLFHKLCHNAIWNSRFKKENVKLTVQGSCLHSYDGETGFDDQEQPQELIKNGQGTVVTLTNFNHNLEKASKLHSLFSIEFAWYLIINPHKEITLNGKPIALPKHDLHELNVEKDATVFNVKFIRWHDKPTSEKSYNYLLNSNSTTVHKKLSSFNNKRGFWLSTYSQSQWLNSFTELEEDCFNQEPHNCSSSVYKLLEKKINDKSREIYKAFLQQHADREIQRYEVEGYFPEYCGNDEDYKEWRKTHLKSIIKSIYILDPMIFQSLNKKQGKILVRLLDKLTVSSENSSLYEILDSVLDLEDSQMNVFAKQLNKSKLDHIISTIEELQNRELTIQKLTELMNNHYKEVLETPDLQKIIENNTWLFGPQYTVIGAEEDDFQKTAKSLRDKIKGIDDISDEDIEDGVTIKGVKGQVDLFLARKMPQYDDKGNIFYKCIIIEIKRPGVSLNSKHLDQLSRYEEIIARHPAFASENMRFELILVGRKISKDDYQIKRQLDNLRYQGEPGLVSSSNEGRIKAYVKNWYTIFDNFKLSNDYLLSKLKTKRDDLSAYYDNKDKLVKELQE